jgi:hypothetical protein
MIGIFNFLARVVGFIFFIVCGGIGIYEFNHRPDEVPWFITPLCFILSVLGLLMVFARPYKPNGDDD